MCKLNNHQSIAILYHNMHPIHTKILVTTPHRFARSETKSLRVDTRLQS